MSELLTAEAYGVPVGLLVGPDELPAVLASLPHWWDASAPPVTPDTVFDVRRGASLQEIERLISTLELHVAEHAQELVFLHAGVVAVDGRALLLPGRSFAGKSTLTAALVRAGADYGSDEYAPLSADGRVEAYPRRLWMRPTEGGPRVRVPVAELGGAVFRGRLPVAGVALLRFDAAAGWAVEGISPGTAVLGMVDNCVPARSRPEPMFDALTAVAGGLTLRLSGTRGDADTAARALLAALR